MNSSIIQDEVLAHRVGLIPIRADARKLDYVIGDEETDKDTIVFHFDVECTAGSGDSVINGSALSGAMKWLPQGSQNEVFPEGVAPVHDDIVVAKLKPGQRIEFEAHCRKGVGEYAFLMTTLFPFVHLSDAKHCSHALQERTTRSTVLWPPPRTACCPKLSSRSPLWGPWPTSSRACAP